jgi:hypothetical protein
MVEAWQLFFLQVDEESHGICHDNPSCLPNNIENRTLSVLANANTMQRAEFCSIFYPLRFSLHSGRLR